MVVLAFVIQAAGREGGSHLMGSLFPRGPDGTSGVLLCESGGIWVPN